MSNKYINSLFNFSNQNIIVLGASRGIGIALAKGLADAGANVFGFGRSEENNEMKNQNFVYKSIDFNSNKSVQDEYSKINDLGGNLSTLINVAGISSANQELDSFMETIQTNLVLTYQSCSAFADLMNAENPSSIINITSIGAHFGFPSNPAYTASKAAVSNLSKSLAIDYAKKNIRVNNIVPGYIKTDMTIDSYLNEELNLERLDRMIIKRWGEPQDLIGAALFLSSKASSYVTGANIVVDGGWTAKGL
ncbi:SDR family oxidoreductase [Gammaproteobacteria bacterium]|jgi:gluconate 5-dehydrogenase|nr:SDR family oxidoreductase [Gammaproteobacteria bacterium]